MAKLRSRGVTVFGVLLVLGSLFQIWILWSAGYAHYSYLHQEYSSNVIYLRYIVSWVVKIIGLILGVGILRLNDWCRKLAIINCILLILTVHLKHSYPAYSLHLKYLDQMTGGGAYPGMSFESLIWPALIAQRSLDIIFGIALIYFFTRPSVRKQFQRDQIH